MAAVRAGAAEFYRVQLGELERNCRMTRRVALQLAGGGFGILGLAGVLRGEAPAGKPLAVKPPHFPAKAKNVIFLFLNGGISQVDTFDPKPALEKHHGEPMPGPKIK